jgi:hypothetical protein
VWLHHWQHPATRDESETIGTFYFHGFSLEDLMAELGCLERQALGYVKHGEVPREGHAP